MTFNDTLLAALEADRSRPLFDYRGRTYTKGEIADLTRGTVALLDTAGVPAGAKVGVVVRNRVLTEPPCRPARPAISKRPSPPCGRTGSAPPIWPRSTRTASSSTRAGATARSGAAVSKVSPERIVAAFHRHPAVLDAAAVGLPDDRLGEVPVAAIEIRNGMARCG